MPIKIVRMLPKAASPAPAVVATPKVAEPASELPRGVEKVIPLCKYCGHPYLAGGCNFEQQKTCRNGYVGGKKRKVSKVPLK